MTAIPNNKTTTSVNSRKPWAFDLAVDVDDCPHSMTDLMKKAAGCKQKGNIANAITYLERCSGYLPAMLELARIYLQTPSAVLGIDLSSRLKIAEALLIRLENIVGFNSPEVCMELSELYKLVKKPVAAYGYLLRARRYGAIIPKEKMNEVKRQIKNMDVLSVGNDPHGAYILGYEASLMGPAGYRWAIWLLQEAVDNGIGIYVGIAALTLSECFEDRKHDNLVNVQLAIKYREIAAKLGFPNYLRQRGEIKQ